MVSRHWSANPYPVQLLVSQSVGSVQLQIVFHESNALSE